MEIAILVFFIAIFGGVLFLAGLIWFIFRRIKRSSSANRSFSSNGSNYGSGSTSNTIHNSSDTSDDSGYLYAGSAFYGSQETENRPDETTQNQGQSEISYAAKSLGASAAPLEPSSGESAYLSYDSSSSYESSYDSSSSYDSGSSSDSSSSDSGSSSSSD